MNDFSLFDYKSSPVPTYGSSARATTNGYKNPAYYKVYIIPNEVYDILSDTGNTLKLHPIVGYITEEPTFNYTAEWVPMEQVDMHITQPFTDQLTGRMSSFGMALGGGKGGVVARSKKLWQKNGYTEVDLKFRVVDEKGNGAAVTYTTDLLEYCCHRGRSFQVDMMMKFISEITSGMDSGVNLEEVPVIKQAIELFQAGQRTLEEVYASVKNEVQNTRFGDAMIDAWGDIWKDRLMFRNAPPPVKIRIGNIFDHTDMIIESVSFTHSKEYTKMTPNSSLDNKYPLWVDVSIKMSSRSIMTYPTDSGIGRSSLKMYDYWYSVSEADQLARIEVSAVMNDIPPSDTLGNYSAPVSGPVAKGGNVLQYKDIIMKASKRYGVPPDLIAAVIQTESSGNATAYNKSGATGLMQIMPSNFKWLGLSDPYNPESNIMAGTKMLSGYLRQNGGDTQRALAAYNWGPGNLQKHGMSSAPLETRNYVSRIPNLATQYTDDFQ